MRVCNGATLLNMRHLHPDMAKMDLRYGHVWRFNLELDQLPDKMLSHNHHDVAWLVYKWLENPLTLNLDPEKNFEKYKIVRRRAAREEKHLLEETI